MEILLILILAIIIGSFLFFKSKLDAKLQLLISVIGGSLLVVWFWIESASIQWKVIVTVVVVSAFLKLLRKYLKPTKS